MDWRTQHLFIIVLCFCGLFGAPIRLPAQTGDLSSKAQSLLRSEPVVVSAAPGDGQGLSKLNPFTAKEPMIADPNRAYPRVASLPGAPFKAVSYPGSSIIAQLAHSSDGIVRLPPGDYSIPVRFY